MFSFLFWRGDGNGDKFEVITPKNGDYFRFFSAFFVLKNLIHSLID